MVELTIHHTHCWTIAQPIEYKIKLNKLLQTQARKNIFLFRKKNICTINFCLTAFLCVYYILYIISSMPISDSEEENRREEMLKNQDTKSKFNEMNVEFENS